MHLEKAAGSGRKERKPPLPALGTRKSPSNRYQLLLETKSLPGVFAPSVLVAIEHALTGCIGVVAIVIAIVVVIVIIAGGMLVLAEGQRFLPQRRIACVPTADSCCNQVVLIVVCFGSIGHNYLLSGLVRSCKRRSFF